MDIRYYDSRHAQAEALAAQVAGELGQAITVRSEAHLAVPGGTTPAPFMQALARIELPWQHVRVTLTDERQVPDTHERSNARLVRENLLQQVSANFIPLYRESRSHCGLGLLEHDLTYHVLPLDVCVLGMGSDGHFASLFPGGDNLAQGLDPANSAHVIYLRARGAPEARISLTLSTLLTAPAIHLLITGPEKLDVLEQAADALAAGRDSSLPVQQLIRSAAGLMVHYAA
ncbi:MAG TPA: 6-phosphogluconolactonase [Thiolinea sp.]|nr:6-phosphogluconolactonase [Thiolinea sp.]